jgi:hypothetical protein
MKKATYHLLPLLCLCLLGVQCKKDESGAPIYGPPSQTIVFTETSDFIIDSTGKTITAKTTIQAANELQQVELIYQPWNIAKTITSFSNPKSYSLSEPILIPANAGLMIHSVMIKATDKRGATNFTEVKVGLQDLNYNKLYLADVTDAASLSSDLFGVPMVMDKTGSHTYQLVYYARTDNIKVRFLPNKTSFTPVAIGLDPANPQKLLTTASQSLPITLGTKGYYKITVNTLLLSYTVENFTPSGNAQSQVAIVGRGFYDFPNMNWQNALPDLILLDKDPVNKYLFTKLVKLGTPPGQTYNTAQFIFTTNNGWTNFWRFDDALNPELAVFNGGANTEIPIGTTPVTYLFTFDTYTGRVQAIRQ